MSSKAKLLRGAALAALLGAGLSGCTPLDKALASVPWFTHMVNTPSYKPYQVPRLPAEGTIPVVSPRGDVPPPFTQAQLDSVGRVLTNPLSATPEVLARGEQVYATHCFVCHGAEGAGNGPIIAPTGPFPYSLPVNSAAVAKWSDGYLYGIVRVGRGFMPAYADRINESDRWAVVTYLRHLGGATPATAAAQPEGAADTATAPTP